VTFDEEGLAPLVIRDPDGVPSAWFMFGGIKFGSCSFNVAWLDVLAYSICYSREGMERMGTSQQEVACAEAAPFFCRRKALHRDSALQKLHSLDRGRR